jgi:DNA-binding NtrC family response regulator
VLQRIGATKKLPYAAKGDLHMTETKILIVDADEAFLEIVKNSLSTQHISISLASTVDQVLKWLELVPDLDVVLLDVQPAAAKEFHILREIWKLFPTVKVVLLTKPEQLGLAIQGMRLGAFDYLIKPGEVKELIAKIEEAKKERTKHLEKILVAGAKVLKQKWLADLP